MNEGNISQNDEPGKVPERALRVAYSLLERTGPRGCTPAEEEIAAITLWRLIHKYQLRILPPLHAAEAQGTKQLVTFDDVVAITDTPRAVLCEIAGAQNWVPRSLIAATSEVQNRGDIGALVVAEWWARSKGLVEGRP